MDSHKVYPNRLETLTRIRLPNFKGNPIFSEAYQKNHGLTIWFSNRTFLETLQDIASCAIERSNFAQNSLLRKDTQRGEDIHNEEYSTQYAKG